jgi:general secretion pathway protein J
VRERGFSLIEMLVAVGLLAAGLALAFGIVQGSVRAAGSAEQLAAHSDRLRTAQGFLRRQLAGALPQPIDPEAGYENIRLLKLSSDRIEFVGEMPGYLGRGGAYLQVFRLQRGVRGTALVFEHRLMTPDGPLKAERPPEVLIDGLADAHFAARAFGPDGRPEDWKDWDRLGQLPSQVRLEARFAEGRYRFPSLVVPLRYSLSGATGVLPEAARRDTGGEGER